MTEVQKKLIIIYLELIKKIFLNGIFVNVKIPKNSGLKFLVDSKTDNGFILGFYEVELVSLLEKYLKPGMVFYDLGAHWGYFSLLASKLVGTQGKVMAFEPMPENYSRLQRNVRANGIENLNIFHLAISDHNGQIKFSNTDDSFANSYLNVGDKSGVLVDTVSLDSFAQEEKNTPPDFIKIDVEGAELDVLKGAKNLIHTYKPLIHLSTHDIHLKGVDKQCRSIMDTYNYKMNVLSSKQGIKDYICLPKN